VTTRVLVVEDEPDVSRLIETSLARGGQFDIRVVHSGHDALNAVAEQAPQLVILDLNLPVLSGIEVCRILRQRPSTAGIPIMMLTARADENARVTGLEVGADDYMTKPFSPRELGARVRALLRRGPVTPPPDPSTFIYKGERLTADFDAIAVSVDEKPVRLTRREFDLLRYLVQNRNRVVSRDRLLERVWNATEVETRSVDVHVGRLRAKLGAASSQIETVVGLGYRFVG
jgi:DNA-binding response OmpR family regulator